LFYHSYEQQVRRAIVIVHNECAYCGKYSQCTDHIIPRCLGGISNSFNMIGACNKCNSVKGGYLLDKHSIQYLRLEAWIRWPDVVRVAKSFNPHKDINWLDYKPCHVHHVKENRMIETLLSGDNLVKCKVVARGLYI
jgi:hypothetical protein